MYNPTQDAVTEQEIHILAETTRFAEMLNVKVHGELSDYVYSMPCPSDPRQQCIAAGWYDRGTCYYYRPEVNRHDSTYNTGVAAHEVCHAKEYIHGPAHDACIESLLGGRL